MIITVDTRVADNKIIYLSENVTITDTREVSPIATSVNTLITSKTPRDIENLQRQNKIDEVNRIITEYGLTLRGTIV